MSVSSVRDRDDRGPHPRVVGRQEAEQHPEEHRGIERGGSVRLREDAAFVDAVLQDVGLDLVGHRTPAIDEVGVAHRLGQQRAAVERHPAHDLRRGEVARLSAVLPDPPVGLAPPFDRALHLSLQVLPRHAGEELARARVQVHRVQQRAPDVVLFLVVGIVADPDGAGVLVAGQVVERGLVEVDPVIDGVQHLERGAVADLVGDEVEEAVRLVVEAERVQPPQRERRVAHPAVSVVPVPFPARRLGERRGGGGQQRARGRVRQALQRERAALQDAAPRMIGERSVVQPSPPEVRGPPHARGRVLVRQRRLVVRP